MASSSRRHPSTHRITAFGIALGALVGVSLPVASQWDDPASAAVVAPDTAAAATVAPAALGIQQAPEEPPGQEVAHFLLTGVAGLNPLREVLEDSSEEAEAEAAAAQAAAAEAAALQAAAEAALTWHVPVASYYISSPFGEMRYSGPHIGLDFAGNNGKPVLAARHGIVTQAGWEGGYGFSVTIDHGDGHDTKYAHLADQPIVAVGQQVVGGQQLGLVGSTGDSTGPHLHFEVLSFGQRIDPYLVINIPPSQGL